MVPIVRRRGFIIGFLLTFDHTCVATCDIIWARRWKRICTLEVVPWEKFDLRAYRESILSGLIALLTLIRHKNILFYSKTQYRSTWHQNYAFSSMLLSFNKIKVTLVSKFNVIYPFRHSFTVKVMGHIMCCVMVLAKNRPFTLIGRTHQLKV